MLIPAYNCLPRRGRRTRSMMVCKLSGCASSTRYPSNPAAVRLFSDSLQTHQLWVLDQVLSKLGRHNTRRNAVDADTVAA
eukprot:355209-Chlamydomonas_euryale.AAC.1